MNKIIILLGIISYCLLNAQAGAKNSIYNEHDNVLNYEKEFGIDLYTGTVNINIPLQKLKEDDLTLDVSLNYDATGVIVNSVSGSVGQNWNLNVGG